MLKFISWAKMNGLELEPPKVSTAKAYMAWLSVGTKSTSAIAEAKAGILWYESKMDKAGPINPFSDPALEAFCVRHNKMYSTSKRKKRLFLEQSSLKV
jgi:hypothetical protein